MKFKDHLKGSNVPLQLACNVYQKLFIMFIKFLIFIKNFFHKDRKLRKSSTCHFVILSRILEKLVVLDDTKQRKQSLSFFPEETHTNANLSPASATS